ncbi:hypothetical protein ACFLVR_04510 [Chloroflexota bacterium]
MKKILIYVYFVVLSLAAVSAFHSGGVQVASAASMNWYFTDTLATNYSMVRTTGTGGSDLAFVTNDAHIWVSDETAVGNLDMSGSWAVTIATSAKQGGAKISIEVGTWDGSNFTSYGSDLNSAMISNPETHPITTTSHTVASGDYIAIRITCVAKSFTLDLIGATDSPTFAASPTAAPDYPGTEIISFTVTDNGATSGITFGPLNIDTTDNPEAEQTGSSGAVTLTVGASTNVAVDVSLKGTDFSGISTYLLSAADIQYDDDQTLDETPTETGKSQSGGNARLTTTYWNWYSVASYTSSIVETYHWITVPATVEADTYSSTFSYQCVAQ